ncbi:uncharacterized protein HD556DRAFT_1443167 [Suillus plorans]|uniref:BTB domain-containing protein n=1 Tax=Suillus plorans TaxID=116603 RepID=A0A9P7DIK0_9AGAM|nr:uncharacterized protein HD556DRAFT_1443167 [Suillus plorans]KAG1794219.1 hypothetical protein HD556DRAFT_1443167 [Suillus plorans]
MAKNQRQIHRLLRKSIIGQLPDTQFYLFSNQSKRKGNITKLKTLFAEHEVLAVGSEYFSNLFAAKQTLDDPAIVRFQGGRHMCEEGISIDEYGYASDSDLGEEDEEVDETVQNDPDEKCGNVSTERMAHTTDENLVTKEPQCTIPSRVLVTDTAFKTWLALLYYMYTNEIAFAPLRSQGSSTARYCSLNEAPLCSPKSMYRLACKIKHDRLQAKALAAIRSSLTEYNILREFSSSLTSRFPPIFEMEVETVFQLISTPTRRPIIRDFPTLIPRIVGADLPYGAGIPLDTNIHPDETPGMNE